MKTTALLFTLMALALINILQVHALKKIPLSSCQATLAQYEFARWEGKGGVFDDVQGPTEDELRVTMDPTIWPER